MSILCSGSFVADILVPDLPRIGSPGSLTYAPSGIHLSPGGHSANVAINLAQLGVKNVYAVGAIGKDEMGNFLLEQLKKRGVVTIPEIKENYPTAKNIALLVKGEDRRYIAEYTANSQLTAEHLLESINNVHPSIFHQGTLGGLPYVELNLDDILKRTYNVGILNFIDVIIPSNGWGYLKTAFPFIHIFHANKQEAYSLTGKRNLDQVLKELVGDGVKLAIISDAQKGVFAGTTDYHIEMPVFQVTQKDPTGAGDALCSGIISYIQTNMINIRKITDPEIIIELLLKGQAAGAACVNGIGATTNVTKKKVKSIIDNQVTQVRKKTRMKKL
jgi:sugar/nucleoside kinase (ribokinase family)